MFQLQIVDVMKNDIYDILNQSIVPLRIPENISHNSIQNRKKMLR